VDSPRASRDGGQHSLDGSRQIGKGGSTALAGRRRLIAELIDAAQSSVTIAQIADRLDIHPNTVRFHLDALVADGQVERVLGNPTGPGRPAQMFRTRQGMPPNGPRNYRLLAEIGLSTIAGEPDPAAKVVQTGQAWGEFLIERPAPGVILTEDEAVHRLLDLLTDIGFAPEQQSSVSGSEIGLRNCPFLELVETKPQQIICRLHLGLMQGAMAALNARTTVDQLEPFAEPGRCLAHLSNGETP
jgi:predicted ArsR family transcriptional regulator